jgi:hypothetical protein
VAVAQSVGIDRLRNKGHGVKQEVLFLRAQHRCHNGTPTDECVSCAVRNETLQTIGLRVQSDRGAQCIDWLKA